MKKIIVLASFMIVAANVFGQADSFNSEDLKNLKVEASKQFGKNFTPFGNGALSNFVSNISVTSAFKEGVNGKVELKYQTKSSTIFGLYADQKIGSNDKQASFIDFTKGISPGTTIGLNIQKTCWSPQFSAADRTRLNNLRIAYGRGHPGIDDRTISISDILKHGTAAQKDSAKAIGYMVSPVFFNFGVSFTKSNFSYSTDSVTLNKVEANYLTPNIKLSVGIPFKDLTGYFGINYAYSSSYKAADDVDFSSPFGTTANFVSQTLAFGKPTRQYDHKISLEVRKSFGGDEPVVAIDPTLIYGFKSEKLALSVPVYFIKARDDNGKPIGLQGGINIGYATPTNSLASFKNGSTFQLILTAPFDLFGGL